MAVAGERVTWHYGLVARWWAEFDRDGADIGYFQRVIERCGEPALDLACGSGRLLLPFLRAGLDFDGCDVSEACSLTVPRRPSSRGSARDSNGRR